MIHSELMPHLFWLTFVQVFKQALVVTRRVACRSQIDELHKIGSSCYCIATASIAGLMMRGVVERHRLQRDIVDAPVAVVDWIVSCKTLLTRHDFRR